MEWVLCSEQLPASDIVVDTKVDDEKGCRNMQTLKLHSGLWFFPDMSMYIYYTPTHWRYL